MICFIGEVAAPAALTATYRGLSAVSGRNLRRLSAWFQEATKSRL
jgi:hypothetical protein